MRSLWLLVALGAVLTACDSSGTDPFTPAPSTPDPVEGLVPLAVGNEWVFAATSIRFDQTTGAPRDTVTYAARDTLRVVSSRVRNGETWYRLEVFRGSTQGGGSVLRTVYTGWVTNRADGYYQLLSPRSSGEDSTAFRAVAYPVSVGDVYAVVPPFSVTDMTGFHFETNVAVKRTDYPVKVGERSAEGVLYTSTLLRLWVAGRDYGFPASTPPLRAIYAPGLGFAYLETGYAGIGVGESEAYLGGLFRFTLTDVSLVATAEN